MEVRYRINTAILLFYAIARKRSVEFWGKETILRQGYGLAKKGGEIPPEVVIF